MATQECGVCFTCTRLTTGERSSQAVAIRAHRERRGVYGVDRQRKGLRVCRGSAAAVSYATKGAAVIAHPRNLDPRLWRCITLHTRLPSLCAIAVPATCAHKGPWLWFDGGRGRFIDGVVCV